MATVTTDNDVFSAEVFPTVERYARGVFRDDEDSVAIALVLAWWYWRVRPQDFAASHWARLAVRAVRNGRDLPRFGRTRECDALSHAVCAAGMDELTDRKPGPERIVEARELLVRLTATLTDRERLMVEMLTSGEKAVAVSRATGISAGRVTQVRQALMDRLIELE